LLVGLLPGEGVRLSIAVKRTLGSYPQDACRAIRQPAACVLVHAMAAPAELYSPVARDRLGRACMVTDNWPDPGTLPCCASRGASAVVKTLVNQERKAGGSRGARGDCRGGQT